MTETIRTDIRAIDEVAAQWHAQLLLGRLSPEDEQRLDAWLAEDLRHRLAYAEVAAAGYALEQASPKVEKVAVRKEIARRWPGSSPRAEMQFLPNNSCGPSACRWPNRSLMS